MSLFYTDKIAYWHMPKTGGMSVYRVLKQLQPPGLGVINSFRRHGRAADIPSSALTKRALFGSVRDPWSWYTSLYNMAISSAYPSEQQQENVRRMGNGSSEFKDFLFGATHPLDLEELPRPFPLIWDPDPLGHYGAEIDYLGAGLGLCSWTFRFCYGKPPRPDLFINTSTLYEGLAEVLNEDLEKVQSVTPQNRASHRPASWIKDPESLYDDEMKEWVAKADAPLIQMFGYEPFMDPEWTVMKTSDLRIPPSLV